MKVILTSDIKNVGKKDDLITVSDGYARNFLFPKKLAIEATDSNLNTLNFKKEQERKENIKRIEEFQNIANKIKDKEIIIKTKIGNNGKLFGTITNKDVCSEINKMFNLDLDKKKVILNDQIKCLGVFTINIKLCKEVSTTMSLRIIENI